MASARILQCAVHVESAPDIHSSTCYTISGEGAAALREICKQHAMNPSPMEDGKFTQRTLNIDYTQSTSVTCFVRDALRDATKAELHR